MGAYPPPKVTTTTVVRVRRKSSPTVAKDFGYTKNHFLVEGMMGGRWRMVGFYTPHQVFLGAVEKKVKVMMKQQLKVVVDAIVWEEDL